jgi:hypothetical protein
VEDENEVQKMDKFLFPKDGLNPLQVWRERWSFARNKMRQSVVKVIWEMERRLILNTKEEPNLARNIQHSLHKRRNS